MKEPVEHVRRPRVPWRTCEPGLTECGLETATHPALSREEMRARWKEQGQTRAALTTCMTCIEAWKNWPDWEQSPAGLIAREAKNWHRERWGQPPEPDPFDLSLRRDLEAIAALVDRHRGEFDGLLRGLSEVVDIKAKRAERAAGKQRRRREPW